VRQGVAGALGENLNPVVRHQHGVLKLCGQQTVHSHCCPVVRPHFVAPRALGDHRLYRETVARLHDSDRLVFCKNIIHNYRGEILGVEKNERTGIVGNAGGGVEELVDAVAAVAAHHREVLGLRVLLNYVADFSILLARFH
jgi:hypothetical protein